MATTFIVVSFQCPCTRFPRKKGDRSTPRLLPAEREYKRTESDRLVSNRKGLFTARKATWQRSSLHPLHFCRAEWTRTREKKSENSKKKRTGIRGEQRTLDGRASKQKLYVVVLLLFTEHIHKFRGSFLGVRVLCHSVPCSASVVHPRSGGVSKWGRAIASLSCFHLFDALADSWILKGLNINSRNNQNNNNTTRA